MARGVAGLPRILHSLGYREAAIEAKITFISDSRTVTVCPELLLSSEMNRHTILLEVKSGRNTDNEQLARYGAVTREILHRVAGVFKGPAETFDVVINGDEQHAETLTLGVAKENYPFPIVVKTAEGLKLVYNEFKVDQLTQSFTEGLEIDWNSVPSNFIPIDAESELWEVADVIMPHVLALMAKRAPRILVSEICARACEGTWGVIGPKGQTDILNRVRKVLHAASMGEFKPFLKIDERANITYIRIENNPLEYDTTPRSRVFKRFHGLQERFVERLRTGVEFQGMEPFVVQEELPLP
jgi:hypothetical protein